MKNITLCVIFAIVFFVIGFLVGRQNFFIKGKDQTDKSISSTPSPFYGEEELKAVNLKGLDEEKKRLVIDILNTEKCQCPICLQDNLTIARCVVERKECRMGHILARKVVKLVREGKTREEISKSITEPERIEVSLDGAIIKGSSSAPVTIIEFTDFQCPFSKKSQDTLKEIEKNYGDKVRIAYRSLPLKRHKFAEEAARAALAAYNQGRFWEMKAKLFEYSRELTSEKIVEIAKEIGLDMDRFKKDMVGPDIVERVKKDIEYAKSIKVSSTPTFFINGIKVRGAQPFEYFKLIIDKELSKKGEK